MNGDLGLGIVVSMKDAFTRNAQRIQGAMMDLDATVAASSERMSRNMDRIQKGTMMVGAGLSLLAIPTALIASTTATQRALGELASLGVQDLNAIENAAESFTNQWAGANKADFIGATYDVKSALSNLSDEAVGVFTQMAALTGKATKATTQEMVGTFTTAYGIFKPIMADMTDMEWATAFSGAMSQTVASFKTNGTQMADAIKNIGAVAAASNIPLNEQLAVLGQLQTTMPGSEAGTLYKAFIMKAAEAGQDLGLSFVNSMGQLRGVVPILQEIQNKFPDLSQAASQIELKKAFGSDEAVKFVLQMSAGMSTLEGNIQNVAQAMQNGTAVTEQMANAMNQDIGAQWDLIKQQFHNLSEILGKTLLPVVQPVLKGVSRVILFLQKMARSMPNVTRAVLTLSMALGGILVVAGAVTAAIGMIGIMLPAIQAGLAAVGTVAASVGAAIGTYLLPVIAIAMAVVLAVYLLKKAWETNFGGIRDFIVGVWDKVKLAFEGIKALVTSLNGGVGQMSAELAGKLQQAGLLNFVVTVFKIYYRIREYLRGLWEAFSSTFGKIKAILEPVVTTLIDAFSSLFSAFGEVFEALGLVTDAADGNAFYTFGTAVGSVLGVIAQVGAYLVKLIYLPMTLVIKALAWVVSGIARFVKSSIDGFKQAGQRAAKFFYPIRMIMSLFEMVKTVIGTVFDMFAGNISVTEGLRTIGQSVLNFLLTPFYWARDSIAAIWGFISNLFSNVASFFTSLGTRVIEGFLNLPLISTVRDVFNGVTEFLSGDILGTLFEAGKKLFSTIADGIKSAVMAPVNAIKNGLSKVRDFLPFSDAKVGPLSTLTASGQALLNTIAEGMEKAKGAPATVFTRSAGGMMSMLGNLWGGLKQQGAGVVESLQSRFQNASGLWQNITAGASPVVDSVRNIWSRIRGSFGQQNNTDQPSIWSSVMNGARSILARVRETAGSITESLRGKMALPEVDGGGLLSRISSAISMAREKLQSVGHAILPGVIPAPQMQQPGAITSPDAPIVTPQVQAPNLAGILTNLPEPILKIGQQAVNGVMNLMPQMNGIIPKMFSAALSLVPQVAGTAPLLEGSVQYNTPEAMALPNPENPMVTPTVQAPNVAGLLKGLTPEPVLKVSQQAIEAVMNLVPKLNGTLIPKVLQAALSLTPVMAGELPAIDQLAPVALESRIEQAQPLAPTPVQANTETTTPAEDAQALVQREPIVPIQRVQGDANRQPVNLDEIQRQLQEITTALASLGDRPIDLTVQTNIDGRRVAESVFREMQDQRIRNYETL